MNAKRIKVEENCHTKAVVCVEGILLLPCGVLLSCDSDSDICFCILRRL